MVSKKKLEEAQVTSNPQSVSGATVTGFVKANFTQIPVPAVVLATVSLGARLFVVTVSVQVVTTVSAASANAAVPDADGLVTRTVSVLLLVVCQ